jgi:hypothetical protein
VCPLLLAAISRQVHVRLRLARLSRGAQQDACPCCDGGGVAISSRNETSARALTNSLLGTRDRTCASESAPRTAAPEPSCASPTTGWSGSAPRCQRHACTWCATSACCRATTPCAPKSPPTAAPEPGLVTPAAAPGDQQRLPLGTPDADPPRSRRARWGWLIGHVFLADVEHCNRCSGPMRWLEAATTQRTPISPCSTDSGPGNHSSLNAS